MDGRELARPLPAGEAVERLSSIQSSTGRERPRRAVLVVGALAGLLAVVAVAFAAIRSRQPEEPTRTGSTGPPSDAVVEVDPELTAPILRSISIPAERHGAVPVPTSAHPIVVGQGGVWTIRWRSVFHVDPSRSEVRRRLTLDAGISFSGNLAEGLDEVWVAYDGGLLEVDPATGDQRRVITLGSAANPLASADVTVGGRFVWLGLGDGRLIRFDPRTGRDVTRSDLDAIDTIAFGHGVVWTLDAVGGTVSAYDPATMRPRDQIPVSGTDIVVGDEGLWVLSRSAGTLTRIDPSTDAAAGTVQVGPSPTGITAGDGAIWVGDEDGVIRRVDENTREVTEVPFGAEVRGLVYNDETGNLWVDVV
jgi:streptogramin lyase